MLATDAFFMNCNTQYGKYRTRLFKEIFPDLQTFKEEYLNVGLGGFDKVETLRNLYTLLYARKADDAVYSTDEQKFKMELFSIIFKYGPEYEKKLDVQNKLRNLTDDEIAIGSVSVNNFGKNPSTRPDSQDFKPLTKIDSQSATGWKKGRVDALALQAQALDSQFIEAFLKRFDRLFNPFPPEYPLLYTIGD